MRRFLLVITFSFAILTNGCGGFSERNPSSADQFPPGKPADEGEVAEPGTLSFINVKDVVFGSPDIKGSCLHCHSAQGGNKENVNLETYGATISQIEAIEKEIDEEDMPPLPWDVLDSYQVKVFSAWLVLGAPEVSKVLLPAK